MQDWHRSKVSPWQTVPNMSNSLAQITQLLKKRQREICHVQWDHQSCLILTRWSHFDPINFKNSSTSMFHAKNAENFEKKNLRSNLIFHHVFEWPFLVQAGTKKLRHHADCYRRCAQNLLTCSESPWTPKETRCHQHDVFIYARFLLTIVLEVYGLSQWRLRFHFRPGHYRQSTFLRCFRFTCPQKRNSSVVSVRERANSSTWNSFLFRSLSQFTSRWVCLCFYL